MRTFVAYRLPNSSEAFYFTGFAKQIGNLSDAKGEGVLLHSFEGDRILFVQDLQVCEPENFQIELKVLSETPTTKSDYKGQFDNLIREIKNGTFQKVILSRTKSISCHKSPTELFNALNKTYHSTFNYLIANDETGCWIGATPESLFELTDHKVTTVSLAGTKTMESQWTQKELEEQQFVTDYLKKQLSDSGCTNISVDGPETTHTGVVDHLKSVVCANVDPKISWVDLAEHLHPTPATCGLPKNEALNYIVKNESHSRKFYTGFIGLIKNEEATFFVNLRCMELFRDKALLYVGGGITAQSEMEKEFQETEKKAETMVKIIEQ